MVGVRGGGAYRQVQVQKNSRTALLCIPPGLVCAPVLRFYTCCLQVSEGNDLDKRKKGARSDAQHCVIHTLPETV